MLELDFNASIILDAIFLSTSVRVARYAPRDSGGEVSEARNSAKGDDSYVTGDAQADPRNKADDA